MKRTLRAYILISICILMQVAAVFPHHHHSDIFCLSPDLAASPATPECSNAMHHSDDKDQHTCGTACVTKFQCGTPDSHQDDAMPGYAFYTILHPLICLLRLPDASEAGTATDWSLYVENLHARNILCAAGLRAPPQSVFFV